MPLPKPPTLISLPVASVARSTGETLPGLVSNATYAGLPSGVIASANGEWRVGNGVPIARVFRLMGTITLPSQRATYAIDPSGVIAIAPAPGEFGPPSSM